LDRENPRILPTANPLKGLSSTRIDKKTVDVKKMLCGKQKNCAKIPPKIEEKTRTE
jgi:hypothetical protein